MARTETFGWSWKIGKLLGISIRVHITLVLLLLWVAASNAMSGLLLVATVFAIIVLHELGHAVVARRFGCITRDIVLLPIGGMARIDRMPERPSQELLVALAGPAVNVALALACALVVVATGSAFDPSPTTVGGFAAELLWINVALAVFNLVPAFPMDGGRVLRAALAIRIGAARATRAATSVAKVFAVAFAIIGLIANPMLALIGVFIWVAAQQESSSSELRARLAGITVARAMIQKLEVVESDETIDSIAERMLAGGQRELVVMDKGQLVGVVLARDLVQTLPTTDPRSTVTSVMQRDVPEVAPTATLESVLPLLERSGVVVVVERGGLLGLLTHDQLGAYAALHPRPGRVGHGEAYGAAR